MVWINTKDKLPEIGKYVLCKHNRGTWFDNDDQKNVNAVVLKFVGNGWTQFGPDNFGLQEIDWWLEIPNCHQEKEQQDRVLWIPESEYEETKKLSQNLSDEMQRQLFWGKALDSKLF